MKCEPLWRWIVAACVVVVLGGCKGDGEVKATKFARVVSEGTIYTGVYMLVLDGETYLVNYHGGIVKHEPKDSAPSASPQQK